MNTIIPLQDKALPEECYVYKHSTTCPVSAAAGREVRELATTLPIYWVNVREQRELSNWVASTYGVQHESPQLILVKGGKAVQTWSHYEVTRSRVAPAAV